MNQKTNRAIFKKTLGKGKKSGIAFSGTGKEALVYIDKMIKKEKSKTTGELQKHIRRAGNFASDRHVIDAAWCESFISQEHTQWEKELKIGDLRQWLNEDRIVDPNKMIKNEDIKIMLGLKSECLCLEDNKMTQALCPIHGKQGK